MLGRTCSVVRAVAPAVLFTGGVGGSRSSSSGAAASILGLPATLCSLQDNSVHVPPKPCSWLRVQTVARPRLWICLSTEGKSDSTVPKLFRHCSLASCSPLVGTTLTTPKSIAIPGDIYSRSLHSESIPPLASGRS